jgi:3-isopropylmalate/(R)-2-methylmalate dehydratase small subunit
LEATRQGHVPSIVRGRAWVFGSGITTDEILPGRYLDRSNDEVGQFAMAGIDETFTSRITPGDVIVAGSNFGCGSSRETAPIAIKNAGIAVVIAESFARIFFRNAINIGLPPVVIDSTVGIQPGDELEVDFANREVHNLTTGQVNPVRNLRGISWEILQAGGIIAYTQARMQQYAEVGSKRNG